jgi:Copper type II ascorbate-dependent monooxygenase, C-terminal domain
VQDTCTPKFAGLAAGEPVRIFSFTPHMHKLGRHMRTWIARKDGKVEKVHDSAFQFDSQISYQQTPMHELYPGDKLVNECTFFNDTTAAVGFGPSSNQEMCYQFTYAYPASALVNGVSTTNRKTQRA